MSLYCSISIPEEFIVPFPSQEEEAKAWGHIFRTRREQQRKPGDREGVTFGLHPNLIQELENGLILPSEELYTTICTRLMGGNSEILERIRKEFRAHYESGIHCWGKLLERRRESLDMSREELANELDLDPETLVKWESGKSLPDQDEYELLLIALNWDRNDYHTQRDDAEYKEFKATYYDNKKHEKRLTTIVTLKESQRNRDDRHHYRLDGTSVMEEVSYSPDLNNIHAQAEVTEDFAQFLWLTLVKQFIQDREHTIEIHPNMLCEPPTFTMLEKWSGVNFRNWLANERYDEERALPLQRSFIKILSKLNFGQDEDVYSHEEGGGVIQESTAEKLVRLHLETAWRRIPTHPNWPSQHLPSAYGEQIMDEANTLTGYAYGCLLYLGISPDKVNQVSALNNKGFHTPEKRIMWLRKYLHEQKEAHPDFPFDEERFNALAEQFISKGGCESWKDGVSHIVPSRATVQQATKDLLREAQSLNVDPEEQSSAGLNGNGHNGVHVNGNGHGDEIPDTRVSPNGKEPDWAAILDHIEQHDAQVTNGGNGTGKPGHATEELGRRKAANLGEVARLKAFADKAQRGS